MLLRGEPMAVESPALLTPEQIEARVGFLSPGVVAYRKQANVTLASFNQLMDRALKLLSQDEQRRMIIDQEGQSDVEPEVAEQSTAGLRLLFVDDEPAIRRAVRRILEKAGHDVTVADGPMHALTLAHSLLERPDLLITDVVMPGMNGRELADRLLERWPGLPVLFVSGYSEDVIVKRGVLMRGNHLRAKPFSPEQLDTKIRQVLEAS